MELKFIEGFLAPAGIFVLFGSGFLSFKAYDLLNYYGEKRSITRNIAETFGYGCVNLALSVGWLIPLFVRHNIAAEPEYYLWFAVYGLVIQPILLGAVPALLQTIARKRNSYFLPTLATAWDWAFSRASEYAADKDFKVIVNLDNGRRIAGAFGRGAFASSSSGEQIYLTRLFTLGKDGKFLLTDERDSKGVILLTKSIRSVELYPGTAASAIPWSQEI